MSSGFFKATELRDKLALDGMSREQVAELLERMAQDSPNRVWFMPYNAERAAASLGWSKNDQVKVMSAAVRLGAR